jgi:signal transduction histidine kinase
MVTLPEWSSRCAKLPLVRLVAAALVVQVLYFSHLAYSGYRNQLEKAAKITEIVSLGVQQSNRALIESAMMSALVDPAVRAVVLCSGSDPAISYPPNYKDICRREKISSGNWVVRNLIAGQRDTSLRIILSPFRVFRPLYWLSAISLAMLAAAIWIISSVLRRLKTEILVPLSDGITSDTPLHILELEKLRVKNMEYVQLVRELAVSRATSDLAAQVAHDIRSPLAALGASVKGIDLPEEQRTLIDGAVGRMQGIADDLLRRYRAPGAETKPKVETRSLAGLIEQVVAEKRIQHKERPGLDINFRNHADGAKAAVDPKELQRIISNLVNNAVEALDKGGAIAVALSAPDGTVRIEVSDDGKGIPPEILSKLGRKGETHGKTGGTGLGLYHARTAVESWGGSLAIESEPGKGTAVTISLPAAAKPAAGLRAVLLDDDPLVHMNWRMAAKAAGAELKTYKTPGELAAATNALPRDIPLYIDSELADGARGEDIAAELHEKGFSDITMATGHGPDKFKHLPWLKVAGKEPPWS